MYIAIFSVGLKNQSSKTKKEKKISLEKPYTIKIEVIFNYIQCYKSNKEILGVYIQ